MSQIPSLRQASAAEHAHKQRIAGHNLFIHLVGLFAIRKISAKDFSIACHWAHLSGISGADFESYGVALEHFGAAMNPSVLHVDHLVWR